MKQNKPLVSRVFRSSLANMTAAVVVTMLGILIDGIVIGRFLGPDSMAAYTLVNPIVNFVSAFSGVMTVGVQVLCALHLGMGNVKRARDVFSMCMVITAVVSLVLVAGTLVFADEVAVFLGARGEAANLQPLVCDYLYGLALSFPASVLLFEFNALMRLDGDAMRVVVAVVTMTALDIAGDLLNVLVIGGGMLGMGLATTISYLAALAIMLLHFRKEDIIFRFSLKGLQPGDLRDLLVTGFPSAAGSVASMLRNFVLNQIMLATVFTTLAVGALGIVNTVLSFVTCILIGVGLTTAMIAGMILGEQDRASAEQLVRITVRAALGLGVLLAVAVFALAGVIAPLFGDSDAADMVDLAVRGLRIYAFSIVLYGLNNAFVNYTQGMRRSVLSGIFCFLQNFVFVVVPALALVGYLDSDAVWIAFPAGEALTFISIIALAAISKRGIPFGIKDFLFLKEPFGASDDEVLNITISNEDQIVPACNLAEEFCKSKNADKKTCFRIMLFIEELGCNVMEYGFVEDKNNLLELRIVHIEDGWILRLRDNCRSFDPLKWIKLHESEDPDVNMGIKLVCGMAKDVTYVSTLDLNVLTLRI